MYLIQIQNDSKNSPLVFTLHLVQFLDKDRQTIHFINSDNVLIHEISTLPQQYCVINVIEFKKTNYIQLKLEQLSEQVELE